MCTFAAGVVSFVAREVEGLENWTFPEPENSSTGTHLTVRGGGTHPSLSRDETPGREVLRTSV